MARITSMRHAVPGNAQIFKESDVDITLVFNEIPFEFTIAQFRELQTITGRALEDLYLVDKAQ